MTAFAGGLLAAPYLSSLAKTIPTFWADTPAMEEEVLAQVYEKVLPSVVRVESMGSNAATLEAEAETLATPVSSDPGSPSQGQGAGFVWDKAGHIVTNRQVVQDARCIEVTFANGTQAGAELLGTDLSTDLAILKVNLPPDTLQPVTLGDSTRLQAGQPILAFSAPLEQTFTLTSGMISALDQTMQGCENCYPIADVIQTDISIEPGSSGGPLLNEQGEVIGINTWIINRGEGITGISFAPSSKAMQQVIPGLINSQ
jgi:2-alkenal reductase